MELKENFVEIDIHEMVENYGLSEDIKDFGKKVVTSHEFVQDFVTRSKLLFSIRTSDITEQEVKEWSEDADYLKNVNIDELQTRVKIVDKENPYENWRDDA